MQTNHHEPKHAVSPAQHAGSLTKAPAAPERLLRLPAVCEQTGLGKSSVYALPEFPKPLVLSRRAVAWKQSEITAWIESRTKRAGVKS